jgi:nucleoside-diphosphate-sugar epimerase
MRVLVTGAAGFIGSHLCEFLLGRGCDVVGMDNFITGSPDNLAEFRDARGFAFVQHDVTQHIEVEGPLDWVLHFASPASPLDYLELPIQTLKVGALGTHNALGLSWAKGARFLLASTSEVYGDPLVHPQREDYWGHVNPIGPRGVYDEAKRFAEAMTMAYHRVHRVDTRIARIFNSIPADEMTVVFDNDEMYFGPVGEYAERIRKEGFGGRKIQVPAFDPTDCRMTLKPVSAFIEHPVQTDVYEVRTRYGRRVRVTADHSVFRRSRYGEPEPVPVSELRLGDHIAVPAVLPVVERDLTDISIAEALSSGLSDAQLWDYAISWPGIRSLIDLERRRIIELLRASRMFHAKKFNNGLGCTMRRYHRRGFLPLAVVRGLGAAIPVDAHLRMLNGGHVWLADRIIASDAVLWLLGFYMAEGCAIRDDSNAFLSFCSDQRFLDKAAGIFKEHFGLHVVRIRPSIGRGPQIVVHSRLVHFLFDRVFGVLGDSIPAWIHQLPLHRLKWFIEGYREGDGTHRGKKVGRTLCFDTASTRRAHDLNMLLLRFGIVASFGRYETTFKKKYGERRFPFCRLTVCQLSNFDVLTWDQGVDQRLNARRTGDLVWAKVKHIERTAATPYVYDFSVPEAENFVAGNGVACHNTFGPKMRLNDGRAIPAFMTQALRGEPLTVFGDGSQTRSFQYITDLIDGVWRLMQAAVNEPVNLGNPQEMTLLELAKRILRLTGARSEIVFRPLPVDDPKVRQPDITRARALLGWEPRVDTDEGLKLTLEWFTGALRRRSDGK